MVLVIGKTGTGKNSLSNVICGLKQNSPEIFLVPAEASSCTQKFKFCEAFFNNKKAETHLLD